MDTTKTRNYYRALTEDDLCSCAYCKNYYLKIKDTYPALTEYLAGLGIDIEKPFEAISLDPYEGTIEYIAVQYIVMGNVSEFREADISGVHASVASSHPMTVIKEDHYVIEISPIVLEWVI